ncbi:MAG: hypothetical protein KAV98_00040 [Dehalococcoidia bacterium]|nr:hypothetical protein [Dehalococcoidia bacterium]
MAQVMRGPQKEPEEDYNFLLRIFPDFGKVVTSGNWQRFNQLRDKDTSFGEIAELTKMPLEVVISLENPRRCLYKWDHDAEKFKDCVEGKIDP